MNKDRKMTAKAESSSTKWRPIAIVIISLLLILSGVFLTIKLPYQQRVDTIRGEIERIQREVVEPAGGALNRESSRCADFPPFGWTDISCPELSRTWTLPVGKGEDRKAYVDQLLKELDYQNTTKALGAQDYANARGYNGKLVVELSTTTADKKPYDLPTDKEWLNLTVIVHDN